MTLSRRSTIKAIGVIGAGTTLTGTALAVSEHEDDERDPEEMPEDEDTGALRVGHFSPDAPNVDVLIDGEQILEDVAYDELSPYLEVAPGTYTVTITATGDPEAVVYEESVTIDAEYYTAAAIGELEADDENDLEEPIENDEPNEYENSGEYDDDSESNGYDDCGHDDNGRGHDDNGRGHDDNGRGHDDNGRGHDNGHRHDDEDEISDEPEPEPTDEPDEVDEDLETGTFDVLLLVDAGPEDIEEGMSQVRVVHASPDAPAVDVLNAADGMPFFEDVSFSESSEYAPLDPGSYTVDIVPAAEDDLEDDEPVTDDAEDDFDDVEDDVEDDFDDVEDDVEDDFDDVEDDYDNEEDDAQPEPVASADLELEENTAYTAYAIGYLEETDAAEEDDPVTAAEDEPADAMDDADEPADGMDEDEPVDEMDEDERPFTVRVAVDGPMADEEEEPEEPVEDDVMDEDDELEDEVEEAPVPDETEPEDDTEEYEDDANYGAEEPVTADD
ncbi:DUF4397 domain-containing protein [Natronorubrum bangense]|uniref:DUF4397 domain-containing protein n=1 Tax=Natronorubrum bangense JCM 10635 TaxID=1227500 RepID=L9WHP0_9EURY|nr:DUF4397 domain-containing protein [Natronorubrum bangense]ELY47873.1 hypothetical protein C494_11755 [Natronorubrum bangense JCM 10635]